MSSEEKHLTAEEFKQRKRIRTILDERERVKEQKRKAMDILIDGRIDQSFANRMLREAVEDYIMESENAMWDSNRDVEIDEDEEVGCYDYYWNIVELGQMDIEETGERLTFRGLGSYMNFPNPYPVEVTETATDVLRGEQREAYVLEYQIPWDVSIAAYRVVNEFWRRHDLDVEIDDGLPVWGYNIVPDLDQDGNPIEEGADAD